jgi:hypothetical protein
MAGKRVSIARRAAWSIGAVLLLTSVAACTTGGGHAGGGGGGGCTTPTQITGGYPLTAPTSGWYSADTRTSGNVTVNSTYGAPTGFGCNSAELTTGSVLGQDKAQLYSYADYGTAFASINNVSYWAYRSSLSGTPAANLALNVQLVGNAGYTPGVTTDCTGLPCFTTLVYEPYLQSGGQGAITNDVWQHWNATDNTLNNGMWWSSKIASGPGSQGQPETWTWFQNLYSDSSIRAYGFNVGSYNPNMVVAADGLTFGSTTTDF